jgi:hypothetical protein
MAVPARRTSKMRKRNRRGHIKLATPNLAPCPNCGELRCITPCLPKLWILQRQASRKSKQLIVSW